jgi:hypothetical protein
MSFPIYAFSPFQEHSYRVILRTSALQFHGEFQFSMLAYSPYCEKYKRRLMRSLCCLCVYQSVSVHLSVYPPPNFWGLWDHFAVCVTFCVCLCLSICLYIHLTIFEAYEINLLSLCCPLFFGFLYGPCRIQEGRRIVLPRISCVCYEITSLCLYVCVPLHFLGLWYRVSVCLSICSPYGY